MICDNCLVKPMCSKLCSKFVEEHSERELYVDKDKFPKPIRDLYIKYDRQPIGVLIFDEHNFCSRLI